MWRALLGRRAHLGTHPLASRLGPRRAAIACRRQDPGVTGGRAGIEAIDPLGEVFDPNTMEAMMKVPMEDGVEEDTVAQVFQKGYLLKGTLVRAARVGVYKAD